MAASESTIQNNNNPPNLVNFPGKYLRRSSVTVKPLELRFALILLINLILIMILQTFDSGLFSI